MSDLPDLPDELRNLFINPQGYVLQVARAILTHDIPTQTVLFRQIQEGDVWRMVAMVALAEFAEELGEHRGDGAVAWLDDRMQKGLDDPGEMPTH